MKVLTIKYIVLLVGVLSLSFSAPQDEVNHLNKRLYKNIQKVWNVETPDITPLVLPDSLLPHYFLNGTLFKVMYDKKLVGWVYSGRVNSCRQGGCSAKDAQMKVIPEFEFFDYHILIDTNFEIMKVSIFNYNATYGQEVCSAGWLGQFKQYKGAYELKVGKNIDAITGATISVKAITEDVQNVFDWINISKKYLNQI